MKFFNEVFMWREWAANYIQKYNMLSSVRMLQKKVEGFFPQFSRVIQKVATWILQEFSQRKWNSGGWQAGYFQWELVRIWKLKACESL